MVNAVPMIPNWKSLKCHSIRIGSMMMAGMVRSKKLNRLARNNRNRMRQAFVAWVDVCMGRSLLLLFNPQQARNLPHP
ncbi:hypothetical protein D3C81_1585140 [compost metagenome]